MLPPTKLYHRRLNGSEEHQGLYTPRRVRRAGGVMRGGGRGGGAGRGGAVRGG